MAAAAPLVALPAMDGAATAGGGGADAGEGSGAPAPTKGGARPSPVEGTAPGQRIDRLAEPNSGGLGRHWSEANGVRTLQLEHVASEQTE